MSWLAEPDAGAPAEHRDQQREPVRVDADAVRAGVPAGPVPTSAWTSTSSGRQPSRVGATTLPGAGAACSAEEGPAGSQTSRSPVLGHLEDADLLGGAEAVLEARRSRSAA